MPLSEKARIEVYIPDLPQQTYQNLLNALVQELTSYLSSGFCMSQTFQSVRDLVARQEVVISDHGYDELVADGILVEEIIMGVCEAAVIEDYPTYYKGPCVLVLQKDQQGQSIHVVWGIPHHASSPAVVVTAYRPDPVRWTEDFLRRKA